MKIKDYLTPEQIQYFSAKDDKQAWMLLLRCWLAIFFLFYLVDRWTNPFTVIAAIVLLGGFILNLAVIMHECGHHTFFKSSKINQYAGQWLAAAPAFNNLGFFAAEHKEHHRKTGTLDDPNIENYRAYPIDKSSFIRKVKRDLSGQTGFKLLAFVLKSALKYFSDKSNKVAIASLQIVAAQLIILCVVSVLFSPWMYLLWLGAMLTSYMLVVRIRQIAEHGAVPNYFNDDPRNNTRTTIPKGLESILLAPNFVSYHIEHHFMPSVPCYKLKELHYLLKGKRAYDNTRIYNGFAEVIKQVVLPQPS